TQRVARDGCPCPLGFRLLVTALSVSSSDLSRNFSSSTHSPSSSCTFLQASGMSISIDSFCLMLNFCISSPLPSSTLFFHFVMPRGKLSNREVVSDPDTVRGENRVNARSMLCLIIPVRFVPTV